MTAQLFVIDFETTGIDPLTAHPVEVAVIPLSGPSICAFIKPPVSIPPETSAVHHIIDDDVANAADWETSRKGLQQYFQNVDLPILVAHNAEYEKGILGPDFLAGVSWICTYKCALRAWPDAPSHKNEVLRYYLKLGPRGRDFSQATHSAYHDALVTQLIMFALLEVATVDELIKWSAEPARLPKMPMGKHFGAKWDAIPADYLEWVCKQADMRPDVKHCAGLELERRKKTYGRPH